jgi:hypothetical protein
MTSAFLPCALLARPSRPAFTRGTPGLSRTGVPRIPHARDCASCSLPLSPLGEGSCHRLVLVATQLYTGRSARALSHSGRINTKRGARPSAGRPAKPASSCLAQEVIHAPLRAFCFYVFGQYLVAFWCRVDVRPVFRFVAVYRKREVGHVRPFLQTFRFGGRFTIRQRVER